MHGHDADFVARHFHVAAHFGARRAQPGDEALQRRRALRFVIEREIEEFVERVVGFRSEPRQNFRAAFGGAQHMREKRKGRPRARLGAEIVEGGIGGGKGRIVLCLGPQAFAQRQRLAVPRQREQLLFAHAEQRTLQQARQRQIVIGQQQTIGQRHEIHHGDMFGQHQTVGAGHRDFGGLERADDGLEQRPALAHQHQHVAGFQPLRHPALHLRGDFARQHNARAFLALGIEGRCPAFHVLAIGRLDQRPQLDQAGRCARQRFMRRHAAGIAGDAGVEVRRLENAVDRAEHAGAGAERTLEFQVAPALLLVVELPGEMPAHVVEFLGRGALEREDRLLFVADRKHRAPHVRARAAGRELRDDGAHDAPLLRAGVLRLVDQHVVDAEIELVEHPGRRRAREQLDGLVDQVVIVQQRAAVFFGGVARDHFGGDGDERAGAVARGNRALARQQFADAILFGDQPRHPVRIVLGNRAGDDILARLKRRRAKHLEITIDPVTPERSACGMQCGDVFFVVRRAGFESLNQRRPFGGGNQRMREEFGFDRFLSIVGSETEIRR